MKEYDEFLNLFEAEKNQMAVQYALDLLDSGKMAIRTPYVQILTPAQNKMQCRLDDKNICIWKEHVRTAILFIIEPAVGWKHCSCRETSPRIGDRVCRVSALRPAAA